MKQRQYRPSQAAGMLGVTSWTLRRWIREGRVPARKTETGRLYVPADWIDQQTGHADAASGSRCALYVRESSSENKAALQSQADGLKAYASARGYQIVHVVREGRLRHERRAPETPSSAPAKGLRCAGCRTQGPPDALRLPMVRSLGAFRIDVVNTPRKPRTT